MARAREAIAQGRFAVFAEEVRRRYHDTGDEESSRQGGEQRLLVMPTLVAGNHVF